MKDNISVNEKETGRDVWVSAGILSGALFTLKELEIPKKDQEYILGKLVKIIMEQVLTTTVTA